MAVETMKGIEMIVLAPNIPETDTENESESGDGTEAGSETETDDDTEAGSETETDDGTEAGSETETGDGTEAGSETETGDGTEAGSETETMTEDTSAEPAKKPDTQTMFLYAVIGGCLFVVIAALAALTVVMRRKRVPAGALALQIDVTLGNCRKSKENYFLADEFLIGSDKSCDLVLDNPGVSGVHAKLRLKNGEVYLEDCSGRGTYLEGMRIQNSNRLASGDLVSVGGAEFIVTFTEGGTKG